MKNFKLTKRRVAGLAVVLAIASIGIFTGTYAKYVSTLDLDDNATDQDAQVAVWHVGEPVSIGNLFSPYYYADSYHSGESDLGNSGHSSYFKTSGSKSGDTVFNNPTDTADPENLIAPGTRGEKSFRIQDNVKSDGSTPVGSGATEVSYTVKFPALDSAGSRVTFDGSSAEYLKTQLKFKLFINNIPQTSGWVTATVLDTALSNVTLYYDSDGLDDEVTIEWEWPFDDTDGSGTYDSSDVAAAAAQTTVAVNFGTVRYEQVDASVPFNRNGVTRFDNA
ncbi:MAG: hypothetical protein LBS33_04560, partial [Streptococcaceae bacterium]|nr:hypothetical protein [Streptococcaceae bacterium]